ncbi:MAG TPA: HDOD domain-containing protein [Candidatus Binatia bacterium]|nr:HDOD domain-containing protein [Candidatus Binatia bacterium]
MIIEKNYLARQPIFTGQELVFAYEILCRFGPENFCPADKSETGAAKAMDELFLMGLMQMTHGLPAFINCTREFLVSDTWALLPREKMVGEVLETVAPEPEVVAACRRLKQKGHRVALDDYVDSPEMSAYFDVADFIKVDVLATPLEEQERLAYKFRRLGIPLVAEKVETRRQFELNRGMGYEYFQGYFFCKPTMVQRAAVPVNKAIYIQLLSAANRPQIDLKELGELIQEDVSLSYRLLRYLNSPAFPLLEEVSSIPHALRLLGERAISKWVSLVCVAAMSEDKSGELVRLPLVRARFCEMLAPAAGVPELAGDFFLMGLLSTLDGMLDMPMPRVLDNVPVKAEIKEALLGSPGLYRRFFEVVTDYEAGIWDRHRQEDAPLHLPEERLPDLYLAAIEWAGQIMGLSPAPAAK